MKLKRHEKIIELIEQYDIETQDELAELLRKEGFDVTQATVSRDIRKLALSKVPGKNGRQKYALLNHQDHQMAEKGSICFHGSGAEYSGDQDRVRYGYGCCHSP